MKVKKVSMMLGTPPSVYITIKRVPFDFDPYKQVRLSLSIVVLVLIAR